MTFRPRTIRGQIATAFLVCFAFMALTIGVHHADITRLSRSMRFFELAEDANNTILEMRRFEKNYLLYRQGFDYEENLTYTNELDLILARHEEDIVEVIGRENYDHYVEEFEVYRSSMDELHRTPCDRVDCTELETRIRGAGHNLLTLADHFLMTERSSIDRRLRQMVSLPLVSLVALVVLLAFVIYFIGEKVIRPLARITREAEAVADGAFRRITPYGLDRNEIHHLVSAVNGMVTELEKRQEQLVQSRKIASIGILTAGIAHEINNPVNNLSLILESLIEQSDKMTPEERQTLYQEAMDQADRTSDIVKNLLEFSRASTRRVEVVDLGELVDKTARLVGSEMRLHGIRFEKVVDGDIPPLRLDRSGMQQVMLNLLLNAIQAIDHHGAIQVRLGRVDDAEEVRIDVVDDGPGIAREHLGEIFDPFFTTKTEGTGLGLSVSYNIVEKNGGRMEVHSEIGKGARFTIFLPL